MRGVWFSSKSDKRYELKDFDIPSPGPHEVLIRNVAVASNPKDWKIIQWMKDIEGIEGNDVAGYVEAVGEGVTEFKKGDKVAAMTDSLTQNGKWGAYAEYSIAPSLSTYKFEHTSFEDMATLPLAVMTSALGLFVRIGLPTPPEDGSMAPGNGQIVIVNGASSSIGTFAVQLAKHAGYTVIGIAGHSAEVAKEAGADEIVDYRDKDDAQLEQALKQAVDTSGGKLAGAYDGVSSTNTMVVLGKVLAAYGGGKMAQVLPTEVDKNPSLLPVGVTSSNTSVFETFKGDQGFARKWYRVIGRWVDEGKFKPNRVKIMPGGLNGVPEGMDLLEKNKVNAVKLVYRIADTGA